MKLSNSLKYAFITGLAGVAILFIVIYVEQKTIFTYSENHPLVTLSEHLAVLYRLFWAAIVLIIIVFTIFSILLFRIVKNENLTKEALRVSEKRFRTIFEKAPLGIALIDSNTGIIHNANPKYLELIGRSIEEMNNINWMSITHPDDLQEGLAYKAQMNENKLKGFKMSKRYMRPDGSFVWVALSIATVETENKVQPLHITMAEDITDRKRIEVEIIKSQQNFEEAEKLAKIGSWEFDLGTSEVKWSKGHYQLFELENQPSDTLNGRYISACHPDDLPKITEMREKALKTGEGFNYEYRIIAKNGAVKYINCIGEVVKNAEGIITGLKGTGQDITARKKIEAFLKTKEQNALLVRHASQVPGIIYQYQSYPDGKFQFPFVSEGIWDLTGLTSEEAMKDGSKVFNLVFPDDLDGLMSTLGNSITPQDKWSHEFRINSLTKEIRWVRGNSKSEKLADGSMLWHGYFTDITESKNAEEALKTSKEKLEAIFSGSNDAIMLLTKKGFFDCNPRTLEMFRMDGRKEFIQSHPSDLSPALQPDGQYSFVKANEMIDIAYEKGVNRFEWIHRRKNGEVFPAEVLLSAFNYGDERVLQATVHDITERTQAKKRLIESEALLSSILQTLPVAVFCKDLKKDFQYSMWNKKAEDIFGLAAEECIGKNDYAFFSKKDADWYRANDILASKMTGILDIPEEGVERGNTRVIVHTKKTIVRDSNGIPRFLLGVSEDITERKIAEDKIKKSEEKYRSVVQNTSDVIITLDNNYIIQFINHTPSGAPIDKVMSTSIYNYIPKEYQELAKQRFKKIYDTKKSNNYEMPGQHLDGTIAWFSISVAPLFSGDEVIGITLIIRDLTERKIADDKIQQSLKEKEVLLKEVHHRVKNNLQIILSILNLQYSNITDKKTLDLLRDIRSRIKAMSFIHEILYQTNDFSSINFSEYISSITNNLIYSYTPNNSIDLKLDVGNVFLDLDRAIPCGLIINEIVTNALKYAFIGSSNEKRLSKKGEVSISLTQTDNQIHLIIADNGKGFPKEIDYRNTESLGMQLVVTLIQQLRGTISLDNSNGAKYTIIFSI